MTAMTTVKMLRQRQLGACEHCTLVTLVRHLACARECGYGATTCTHSHAFARIRTYTRTIASVPSKRLLAIFCFMLTLLATGFTGDVIRLRQEAAEWREQKELASKRKQDEFASMQARKGGVAMGGGKCGNCGVRLPVSSSSVGATFCVNCGVRA